MSAAVSAPRRSMVTVLARRTAAAASLLAPRDIDCPNSIPTCDACASGWSCIAYARTKTTCASAACVKDDDGGSGSGGGVNPGVIAGPVIAFVLLLAVAIWWARRHRLRDLAEFSRLEERAKRLQAAETEVLTLGVRSASTQASQQALHQRTRSAGGEGGFSPAFPSTDVIGDEEGGGMAGSGQRQVYTARSINLDPSQAANQAVTAERQSALADPFSDAASAHSGGERSSLSQSTNVIPIAYVPSPPTASPNGAPARPPRDPGLELNLPPRRGAPPSSFGLARPPALPPSQNGSITSSSRMSMMSGAPSFLSSNSFAFDAPTIAKVNIASAQRANIVPIGQVKAQPSPPLPPSSFPQLPASAQRPPPQQRKASNARTAMMGKSPLSNMAVTNFPSPSLSVKSDPFNDVNQSFSPPSTPVRPPSPANTFGQALSTNGSLAPSVGHNSSKDGGESVYSLGPPARPYSIMSTQSHSSAVLQSATIVRIGGQAAPPPVPRHPAGLPRSSSANTLGQPSVPPAAAAIGAEAGDRSSAYTSASASSLLKDYTFTTVPSTAVSAPAGFPSSESALSNTSLAYLSSLPLPPPSAANAASQQHTNRETQYSLDSTFDFLPPSSGERPDGTWGAQAEATMPSEAVREREGDAGEEQEFVIGG